MNGWTHFSSWRLWFTCKAAATAWAPSSEIWLDPRLQNVREQTRSILQIHKQCNCTYPTTTLETGNRVDENLVHYFMWPNVSKFQIYSLICSHPIFFPNLTRKLGGDFTRILNQSQLYAPSGSMRGWLTSTVTLLSEKEATLVVINPWWTCATRVTVVVLCVCVCVHFLYSAFSHF